MFEIPGSTVKTVQVTVDSIKMRQVPNLIEAGPDERAEQNMQVETEEDKPLEQQPNLPKTDEAEKPNEKSEQSLSLEKTQEADKHDEQLEQPPQSEKINDSQDLDAEFEFL